MTESVPAQQLVTSNRARLGYLAIVSAIVLVGAFYFAWGYTDQVGLVTGDGPNYLMMAKSYAHPGRDRVAAEVAAVSRFPPLYPLTLAWSGGADSLSAAHAVTIVFLVLALASLFAWQRLCGLSSEVALILVLAVAAVPDIWLAALMIQSEYLYLFLSLAAIGMLTAFRSYRRDGYLYGAALLIALAILTRTVGILLIPSLLLSLRQVPWRQRALALATVVLPLGLWYSLHHSRQAGYLFVLSDYFRGRSLAESIGILAHQVSSLRIGLSKALLLHPLYLQPLADIIGVLGVSSAVLRCFKGEPDGIYICGYLALLAVWPFPGDAHRLLWPILPFFLVQTVLVVRDFWAGHSQMMASRFAAALCASVVMTMALPSIVHAWERSHDVAAIGTPAINDNPTWYWPDRTEALRFAKAEHGLVEALGRVKALVPEGECVISIRPDWVNFYADRHSETPLPDSAPETVFEEGLKATGCRYVFMTPFLDRLYGKGMYPLERISNHISIVDRGSNSVSPDGGMEFILAQFEP